MILVRVCKSYKWYPWPLAYLSVLTPTFQPHFLFFCPPPVKNWFARVECKVSGEPFPTSTSPLRKGLKIHLKVDLTTQPHPFLKSTFHFTFSSFPFIPPIPLSLSFHPFLFPFHSTFSSFPFISPFPLSLSFHPFLFLFHPTFSSFPLSPPFPLSLSSHLFLFPSRPPFPLSLSFHPFLFPFSFHPFLFPFHSTHSFFSFISPFPLSFSFHPFLFPFHSTFYAFLFILPLLLFPLPCLIIFFHPLYLVTLDVS